MKPVLVTMMAVVALVGCSASPFKPTQDVGQQSAEAPTVLWGGQIVDVDRTEAGTRLEIRAHPLGLGDRPLIGVRASGRHFVIQHPEGLDPDQYVPGRYLTAMGTYADVEAISVAGKVFEMPVMSSNQIELWPARAYPDSLDPLGHKDYARGLPRIVSRSTASAGSAGSVSAGPN